MVLSSTLEMEIPKVIIDRARGQSHDGSRFSPMGILESSIGELDRHCVGYTGHGGYCIALVMGIGIARETFSLTGSNMLDSIVAYDCAEVDDAYIGQINMITVSSFCGPQGAIWGYDVARNGIEFPEVISEERAREFGGIRIINGDSLRQSSRMLFGTKQKRHFPLLPGTHVPCAGKYHSYKGRATLYSAVAIGIPEDRTRHACLLMEDVGECGVHDLEYDGIKAKQNIALNMIRSVIQVGKNHGIAYREIIVDAILKEIPEDHIGCALVAAPYFHLARDGFDQDLDKLSLQEWYGLKRDLFLDSYEDSDVEVFYEVGV